MLLSADAAKIVWATARACGPFGREIEEA